MAPRFLIRVAPLALLMLLFCGHASGQTGFQGGFFGGHSDNPNGPTVSPYLNLLQNNLGGATNYQSLVKPLVDQGNAINRQGNALRNLQSQANTGSAFSGGGSRGTGHSTSFMNYSHYFPSRGR